MVVQKILGSGLHIELPRFGFDRPRATAPSPSSCCVVFIRVSVASELEASLHRVQAARQAALTLTLLPASEMLDESGGSA